MVDAAGAEPVLRGLVAAAPAAELVAHRHANVVVDDLAVVALDAPHGDAADDVHAGRVARDDDLGHAAARVAAALGVLGTAHDDEEIGPHAVRREPLVAVDDPLVAVAPRRGLERTGVGAGLVGLGHREARLERALDERDQPLPLLLLGAVLHEDRLVARVRRDDAEQRRRADGVREHLVHVGELEEVETRAAVLHRQVRGPQPCLLHDRP